MCSCTLSEFLASMECDLPFQLISLEHLADLEMYASEKPYYLSEMPSVNQPESTNLKYTLHPDTPIFDVRGFESEYTLAKNSFAFVKKTFRHAESAGRGQLEGIHAYLREIADWIKVEHGAERVICYDFRVGQTYVYA